MDTKALFQLSYGLYVVSSSFDGKDAGCVVNTLQQVTSAPIQLSVAVNKENYTGGIIKRSGRFAATVALEDTSMDIIRSFGFQSSRDTDKFAGLDTRRDADGLPYLAAGMGARFSCRVAKELDAGTHTLFVGELTDCQVLSTGNVMTYAYYHKVKNGKTPPKASSYQPPAKTKAAGWECTVCGYVYEGDPLPEGFICPVCGMPATAFERRGK